MKRITIAMLAALGLFMLSGNASAQTNVFGGKSPQIQFTPFNGANVLAPVQASKPGSISSGPVTRFFNRFTGSLPSLGRQGSSNLPPPSSFPSNYYPNSFQPLPPITSGKIPN